MKVLLLGGTGVMGKNLAKNLAIRGEDVFITSRSKHSDENNIRYFNGDAHDKIFMVEVLKQGYDAIVDFMRYRSEEFVEKSQLMLGATDQYVFTSSARVYANSKEPITEESPRLLDVCKDKEYLNTDEYALAKAREENILFKNTKKNWTIIRPYITYSPKRLQLGFLEKEVWLYRAIHGRSIPLPQDVARRQTTMTDGRDVANAIAALIGKKETLGEIFNLTGIEHMAWNEVLTVYLEVIEEITESRPRVYMPKDSDRLSAIIGNSMQVRYDRLYDRIFDNSKLLSIVGAGVSFTPMKNGITNCLLEIIRDSDWRGILDVKCEALFNKQTKEKIMDNELSNKEKLKYTGYYYVPTLMKILGKIKSHF